MSDEWVRQAREAIEGVLKSSQGATPNGAVFNIHVHYYGYVEQIALNEGAGATFAPTMMSKGGYTMTEFPGFGNEDALAMWIAGQAARYAIRSVETIADKLTERATGGIVESVVVKSRQLWGWVKTRLGGEKCVDKMLERFEQEPEKQMRNVATEIKKRLEFDEEFQQAFRHEMKPLIEEIVDLMPKIPVQQINYAPQTSIAIGPGAKALNIQGDGNTPA